MSRPTRRSPLVTALALVLAVESVTAVAVRAAELQALPAPVPAAAVRTMPDALDARERTVPPSGIVRALAALAAAADADTAADDARPLAARVLPRPAVSARASAEATPRANEQPKPQAAAPKPRYVGRNRMWIPAWGVARKVAAFPCSRSTPPGHAVYRWGCAGRNNVYLFGHASSVMKPLHDAYVRGRLKKGLRVIYADANGKVRTYAVRYWRVVRPDGDIEWAYAAQSRRSMTLQTCVGRDNSHRLVVRLTEVG